MNQVDFRKVLVSLKKNRYKDDLHSAMCYFKSGTVAFISSMYSGDFQVIIKDQDMHRDYATLDEVLTLFAHDELIDYEI